MNATTTGPGPVAQRFVDCCCGHPRGQHPRVDGTDVCEADGCSCSRYRPDTATSADVKARTGAAAALTLAPPAPKPSPPPPVNGTKVPPEIPCPDCGRGFDSLAQMTGHRGQHALKNKREQVSPEPARPAPQPAPPAPEPPAAPVSAPEPAAATAATAEANPSQLRAEQVTIKCEKCDAQFPLTRDMEDHYNCAHRPNPAPIRHATSMTIRLGAFGRLEINAEQIATPELTILLRCIEGFVSEVMDLGEI